MAQGGVERKIGDTLTLSPVECNRSDKDIKGEVRGQVAAKNEQILKGIVTDDNGEPIAYCTVMIKGTRQATATGKQGEFSLVIPDSSQTQTLVFSYVGFETKEMTITKESFSVDQKVIMVELKNMVWMGFVIVEKVKSTAKPISLIPMTNDTASKYFNIFPNPLPAGNELTIQWQKQEEGYYLIELINPSGQSVFSKKIWVDAEARLLNLAIPAVVAGNYFIRIANTKTNKSFTEKIIIQ
ncbi:MAG TPA: carboxypeptidase-like regulatory domain-containing protein, partial [Chitinophagaceae bacterium]